MFLITPEFTVRVEDVVKLVPRSGLNKEQYGYTSGTLVYIRANGQIDKEFTSMSYTEVLKSLSNAKYQ